jgi:hypothetical protein
MNLHEQQQFDFLLSNAVERFVERIEQRNQGAENALKLLRTNPNSEGVWLGEFTDAIFRDFMLDNPEGYCFILCALARRTAVALPPGKIADSLSFLARHAFSELLRQKSDELLEQHSSYQATHSDGGQL